MSGARDEILAAVHRNRPPPVALPDVPLFDTDLPQDRLAWFREGLERMGGEWLEPGCDPLASLRTRCTGVVVSMVPEIAGTRPVGDPQSPASLDDVDVAVLRAAFGVAETGSVCFTEAELGTNALAYLAQHLLVLLDPADIVGNIHQAYLRPELGRARYAVFHTGPSATADIEGVLIRGAQGARSLTVLPLPRSEPGPR
jgi:L-lactate dehydrogenase complex protein LldG